MTLSERSAGRKWNSSLQKLARLHFNAAKEEISKEHHTSMLQSQDFHYFVDRCIQARDLELYFCRISQPVMFASRALTGSERNYQNHENESVWQQYGAWKSSTIFFMARSLLWRWTRSHLVSIYRKHMEEISPRIQRLVVRSFPYQPFNVRYRKGVEIPLADASQ